MTFSPGEKDAGTFPPQLLEKWLAERQQMLVLFCRLAGVDPYAHAQDKPVMQQLREFCQVLVDYMAFGHFEVCERIVQDRDQHPEILEVAEAVFPRLAEATESAVIFNDKYECPDQWQLKEQLHDDLSLLGEELAGRIELEDRLLKVLARLGKGEAAVH